MYISKATTTTAIIKIVIPLVTFFFPFPFFIREFVCAFAPAGWVVRSVSGGEGREGGGGEGVVGLGLHFTKRYQ